jgi:Sulfotransferase family
MAATKLKPPIMLIGNYRSGTTIAQQLIGLHSGIAIWWEPRTLWRYPDPGRRDDESDESDAREDVVRYIRGRFLKFQSRHGDRRVVEKTPSNVLRVPFVYKVFPEATYLYMTRHPFSYISSNELFWHKTKTWSGLRRSLADVPLSQLHYYAGEFLDHMVVRKVLKSRHMSLFGVRYKGIEQDLKEHGALRVIARQWARCNRKAREDLARLGNGRVFSFRYEDLVNDPESVLPRIYDHCGLACNDNIIRAAKEMVDPGRQEKWLRFERDELRAILPEIQEEMAFYGYEIPQSLR